MMRCICFKLLIIFCFVSPVFSAVDALSRTGTPRYNFGDLVNKNAPKGGRLRLATTGTFDSLNPLTIKGIAIPYMNLSYESLMARSMAEPFAVYGLLAKKVKVAKDSSAMTVYLHDQARFHDGSPVTAHDVKVTMETLIDKGLPRFKNTYKRIKRLDIHNDRVFTFHFEPVVDAATKTKRYDVDLPMSVALMPVLSKKQLDAFDFTNSGLTPLMGSGPYMVDHVEQGRFIIFKKNPHYWGKDLPINQGRFNFDHISIEYFKNSYALFQGFMAKVYDIYFETNPQQWHFAYDHKDAVISGKIVKAEIAHKRPVTVRMIIMNLRKPVLQDRSLRSALILAFDSYTFNKMAFAREMQVPHSLFENTNLAHQGKPTPSEVRIFQKYQHQMFPDMAKAFMEGPFVPPFTTGNGDQRVHILKANDILNQSGYRMIKGKRCTKEGIPIELCFMVKDEKNEKIALNFRKSLQKLGITLHIRRFDANQYENKVIEGQFDLIVHQWSNSLSPGTEQVYYFSQKTADMKGSSNYIGIKDPVAESLAKDLADARTDHSIEAHTRALDRYVMHLNCQIPLSYDHKLRFAYWKDRVAFPPLNENQDMDVMSRGWCPSGQKVNEDGDGGRGQ